jgi:hypothetical protein
LTEYALLLSLGSLRVWMGRMTDAITEDPLRTALVVLGVVVVIGFLSAPSRR